MSASSWVQRANSSRSIMWLLVKSSFDINDHILSLILRKMRQLDGVLHLFATLHLANVLAWVDLASIFKLFTSIRWTQCPSYCDWQSVPVSWREHKMWHILQLSLSSLVTCCSWWLHGMLSTFFVVQAVSYCVIKHVTSGPVTIHLLSAAGPPVTPNAPSSALTTAFACSRTWSIIIGENFRLDLCTITFQFRTPERSEIVSVKS